MSKYLSGFEKIFHHIKFQPVTEKKGRLLVEAGHVYHVQEIRKSGEKIQIEAQVLRQAAVSSTPYKTSLTIDSFRLVITDSCSCIYNQSNKCKHIAALIYYVNNVESLSKTSIEQLWGRPSARQMAKEKYSKGRNFCEMFPSSKAPAFVEPCKIAISKLNYEIYKDKIILRKELCDFYEKYVVLTEEKIICLCCDTIEQSTCSDWFTARVLRISASSKAHRIKSRVTKTIESLVSDMLFPKNVDTASTQYGIKKESIARKEYEKRFNSVKDKVMKSYQTYHVQQNRLFTGVDILNVS
ncbi:hypothetical protein PV328_012167 [Microctonus aethiopoides]|uniref:SWIM-type domain-containing protein n=1 Tax=Microctonus aethiopoides TaxID=144406 RepID=A0AA39FGY9_9HYME|nr:hypothetical protein PV328_012167 [Microctonus aethiopoides]